MKAKASTAAEDEAEPKKMRSSRSKRRHHRHSSSSSSSESPPCKRSKKHCKRVPDKKGKRIKASVSNNCIRRHHSLSPRRSHSSRSNPFSAARCSGSSCSSSSSSERSVSPPPRSRPKDVRKKKGMWRGRDRERDHNRRKVQRLASSSSTSSSSDSSRRKSRRKSKTRNQRTLGGTKDGTTRDKMEKGYIDCHSSRSDMNVDEDVDRDEDKIVIVKKENTDIDRSRKNPELESSPSKNVNKTKEIIPSSGENSDAQYLELILRQKALENFRKFRVVTTTGGKTNNEAAGKEALADDRLKKASTKVAEATHFQSQGSSIGAGLYTGSSRSQKFRNGASHPWKQENSTDMSYGAGSPGIFEPAETGGSTQLMGRPVESTRLASQFLSPLDARNGRSVMQRLVPPLGSSACLNQRLGSSAGLNHVNGAPRVSSIVSVPTRERLDSSTHTTPPRPSDDCPPVESISIVGLPLNDSNNAKGTNGDNRKTSEASVSNGSVFSPTEDKMQPRIEDKDGFQKKTFSRMHDGETVEVSYKVYIPKKTPALARRKVQR